MTAAEILMGMFLMLMVGALTFAVMKAARHEVDYALRSNQQADVRQSMDRTMRQIRNARSLGYCMAPPGAPTGTGSPNDCRRIGESDFSLITATNHEVCFYSLDDTNSTGPADFVPLTPPDWSCVRIRPAQGDLVATTRPPTPAATYTTPAWLPTEQIKRVATVNTAAGSPTGFRYWLHDNPTPLTELTTAAQRRDVALVELTVQMNEPGRVQDQITTTMVFQAAPRGARLDREKTYEEL